MLLWESHRPLTVHITSSIVPNLIAFSPIYKSNIHKISSVDSKVVLLQTILIMCDNEITKSVHIDRRRSFPWKM